MSTKHLAFVVSGLIASPALAQSLPQEHAAPGEQAVEPVREPPSSAPLELPHFGAEGQFVLGGGTRGILGGVHTSEGRGSYDRISGDLSGLVGTFVTRNLFLGASFGAGYNGTGGDMRLERGPQKASIHADVGPTVGVNVPLNETVSLFPTLGASYGYGYAYNNTDVVTAHTISVAGGVDLVLPIVEHLSLTVGPFVAHDVYGRQRASTGAPPVGTDSDAPSLTTYGLKLGLLGWM